MNFNPQNFFGLMDFFSILLPGALLTYLLMDEVGPVVLGSRYTQLAGAQVWAAFLFASTQAPGPPSARRHRRGAGRRESRRW